MNNPEDKIEYFECWIKIGNNIYKSEENVRIGVDVAVRTNGMSHGELDNHIEKIFFK